MGKLGRKFKGAHAKCMWGKNLKNFRYNFADGCERIT